MDGKNFINTAQKLLQIRDEPALRSAVSRAYYAAYHCCTALARQLGFQFDKDSPSHERIYQYLRNCGISEIENTAEDLRRLRRRLNGADYDMAITEFQNHVACQWDVVNAQSIISLVEKYNQEPLRTQLRNGLREYQTKIHS